MKTHKRSKTQTIEQLLEKYYAGQSSLEEEQHLREYFTQTQDIPPHLRAEKAAFTGYTALANIQYGNIENMLNTASQISLLQKDHSFILHKPILAIAASLLLISSVSLFIHTQSTITPPTMITDTYNDPQAARLATERILARVSWQLNQGTTQLASLQQFDQVINRLKIIDKIPIYIAPENHEQRRSL